MQSVNYGRVEDLHVRNGEPSFEPAPKVYRTVKLCAQNGPRPELCAEDFALKGKIVELFDHLRQIGEGMIDVLEIAAGLPLLFEVEHKISA
jgi:hypothetical protein